MNNPVISDFKIELPKNLVAQEETFRWMAWVQALSKSIGAGGLEVQNSEVEKAYTKFKRYGCSETKISKRGLELPDILKTDWKNFETLRFGENPSRRETRFGGDVYHRGQTYKKRTQEVLKSLYNKAEKAPNHIVHVSCTGYVSPSPAQSLVNFKNWNTTTGVTHAYHMGCYAAVPGVRMAHGLHARGNAPVVDIVHTELCSLHMNPTDQSPENIVINSLFADGHIKYSLSDQPLSEWGLELINIQEQILPDTEADMTWTPDTWGFAMTLSREVPNKIGNHLIPFVKRLAESSELDLDMLLKEGSFAIHPGGPKILDTTQALLGVSDEQVIESRQVLFERGNMSSATLPHIWYKILNNPTDGKYVLSLAFGPGLTIFGALFRIIKK